MPDTGAPWNIPYVAPADLVADWPTANQAMAEAVADGLDAVNEVLQIISVIKTDTWSESVAASGISGDVTGLTVTITPQLTTSKLLVFGQVAVAESAASDFPNVGVFRDGAVSAFAGAAAGSRRQAIGGFLGGNYKSNWVVPFHFTDNATATTATTYSIRIGSPHGTTQTMYVNRTQADTNNAANSRGASSMTVIEIKA